MFLNIPHHFGRPWRLTALGPLCTLASAILDLTTGGGRLPVPATLENVFVNKTETEQKDFVNGNEK